MLDSYQTQDTVQWWRQSLSVVRQRLIRSVCCTSRETLTSPSDIVLCLMRVAHVRFLSDTRHCPMITSKSFCRTTASDPISCSRSRETLTSPSDIVLCFMGVAHVRFLSDTRRCPMMTSKSVRRTTLPDGGSEPQTVSVIVEHPEASASHIHVQSVSVSYSFSRSRGFTFTWWGCCGLCFWHKPTELARSFLFCSYVCFYLYGPFSCISFHNSPDSSPLSHSVLPVLVLPYRSFQL